MLQDARRRIDHGLLHIGRLVWRYHYGITGHEMSVDSSPIDISNHAEFRWYERIEVTGASPHEKIRSWFREAVAAGVTGSKRARYHPPSDAVFIYAHRDGIVELITVYKYGRRCADIISLDHLAVCDECDLVVDPSDHGVSTDDAIECPWCGETATMTPVPQLDDVRAWSKTHPRVEAADDTIVDETDGMNIGEARRETFANGFDHTEVR